MLGKNRTTTIFVLNMLLMLASCSSHKKATSNYDNHTAIISSDTSTIKHLNNLIIDDSLDIALFHWEFYKDTSVTDRPKAIKSFSALQISNKRTSMSETEVQKSTNKKQTVAIDKKSNSLTESNRKTTNWKLILTIIAIASILIITIKLK